MTPNQKAFLDMIAHSEIGASLLAVSDNGYNVLVGSTATDPLLFPSYADHPRILNKKFDSTAAGRYQILSHNYDFYKDLLNLNDFSPASQDAIVLQMIKECRALDEIEGGDLPTAIELVSHLWASLPGAGYGQHENTEQNCQLWFISAGGVISADSFGVIDA